MQLQRAHYRDRCSLGGRSSGEKQPLFTSQHKAFHVAVARLLTRAAGHSSRRKHAISAGSWGCVGVPPPFIPSLLRVLLHRSNSVVFHHNNKLQVWPSSAGNDRQELERLRCFDRRDGQPAWDAEGIPAVGPLMPCRNIRRFRLCWQRMCVMACLQVLGADAACPVAVVQHQGLGR